ncbi:hypothetical protein G7Z17_g6045 [Cylindrodendrum hubeiense]|uniref:Uncharacterized protein n=1 Tax=Cylindrodendrum hubeiense TaxID=595255 RepID=A0A9P5LGQ9_9HYPO|nr:hypothetical protein G7Z17_g6045 [Cylindrodendrum hubeiense]
MSLFPPVDAAVLQNNPEFAILYGKLTHVVLNPDGSTKEDPAAKERAAVREELDRRRLAAAKNISSPVPLPPPPPTQSRHQGRPGCGRNTNNRHHNHLRSSNNRASPSPWSTSY